MLWGLRAGCLAVAAGAAVVVFLVLGNVAQPTFGLHRLREPSLVLWGGLALFVLLHLDPVTHWHRWRARLGAALDHPACYPAIAGVMLAVFLTSAASRHLAFYTGSHDFSMIDEALYQSHRGRLLYSPVLGRSFLSEHFSPILLFLLPLHALAPTPWLLVLAQPVVLWASGLLLRATLVEAGVAGGIANLALLAYLNHSRLVSALEFPVHMESALPLLVLALYRAARRGRLVSYWAAATLALAVKEDVGLYLAGFGAWLALAERRRRLGIATAAAGLAWTLLATQWVIPAFAPPGGVGFRFLDRWSHWGQDPLGILIGMATHPLALAGALLGLGAIRLFAGLLFLSFLTRWGGLLVLAPWAVNATSGYGPQASFSLYYGIPLLAFATVAAAEALRGEAGRRLVHSGAGPVLAAALVVLNVAEFRVPAIPRERSAVLEAIGRIPSGTRVQAMACFFPVLGYERAKTLVDVPPRLDGDWVVLRTHSTTWPLSPVEATAALRAALASGDYRVAANVGGTWLLERRRRSP